MGLQLITSGFLFFALVGCQSSPRTSDQITTERVYRASYEETWRAVQQSIMPYPLRVNNMDTGQVQTTTIKGSNAFTPPNAKRKGRSGSRYKLNFSVLKLSKKRSKVSISKNVELIRDFFSKPEEQGTDGLEETLLLYRIAREISIERKLVKATSNQN